MIEPVPMRQAITPRDIQVARWIARGKERNEVASILQTSRSAINRHMIKIMKTTESRNGTQAVATLMALGLLTPSDVTDVDVPAREATARRIAPDLSTGFALPTVKCAEVAAWLRSRRVASPIDDAEEHVNICLDEMAAEWEARA